MRDENTVFAEWSEAEGLNKAHLHDELFRLLWDHAYRVVCQLLHSAQDDVVAASVTRAMNHLTDFKHDAKFSTWFQTIVMNECWRFKKWQKAKGEIHFWEEEGTETGVTNPEDSVHAKLEVDRLLSAIKPPSRQLLQWKLEGDTNAEIAERLGVSEMRVEKRWQRLKKELCLSLQPRFVTR